MSRSDKKLSRQLRKRILDGAVAHVLALQDVLVHETGEEATQGVADQGVVGVEAGRTLGQHLDQEIAVEDGTKIGVGHDLARTGNGVVTGPGLKQGPVLDRDLTGKGRKKNGHAPDPDRIRKTEPENHHVALIRVKVAHQDRQADPGLDHIVDTKATHQEIPPQARIKDQKKSPRSQKNEPIYISPVSLHFSTSQTT